MPETFTDGHVSIQLDQDALTRQLDRVTNGAASGFINAAKATLEPIKAGAISRWPVATGRSRESFVIWSRISGDRIDVGLGNTATGKKGFPYPSRLRWSVFLRPTVEKNLAEREKFMARGNSPEARTALGHRWDQTERLTSSAGAPSAQVAGKKPWNRLVRTPGKRAAPALVDAARADLNRLAQGS